MFLNKQFTIGSFQHKPVETVEFPIKSRGIYGISRRKQLKITNIQQNPVELLEFQRKKKQFAIQEKPVEFPEFQRDYR